MKRHAAFFAAVCLMATLPAWAGDLEGDVTQAGARFDLNSVEEAPAPAVAAQGSWGGLNQVRGGPDGFAPQAEGKLPAVNLLADHEPGGDRPPHTHPVLNQISWIQDAHVLGHLVNASIGLPVSFYKGAKVVAKGWWEGVKDAYSEEDRALLGALLAATPFMVVGAAGLGALYTGGAFLGNLGMAVSDFLIDRKK